jgi:hypothetical protein
MKALISACALCGLIWLPAAGQRGGGFHGGFVHAGGFGRAAVPSGSVGIPPLGSLPPMGTAPGFSQRGFRGARRGFDQGGGYGYWFPGFYDDNGGDYAPYGGYAPYQATPSMVVVMPEQQPAPPRIVQGEVRDYTKTNATDTEQGPPAEFSIVGKDHVGHPAIAVWAQDNTLHYIDADGAAGSMPLSAVDREATRQANSAKGLRLQLSAE